MSILHRTHVNKSDSSLKAVTDIIKPDTKVMVLTGAGCSTASGLGDYRDKQGQWKRAQPITGQTFRGNSAARHRYWARSSVGWPAFGQAIPNLAHNALAKLETAGVVQYLVTQNVDQLHQSAGHQSVIDLHGVLGSVSCLECKFKQTRDQFQLRLMDNNPWLASLNAHYAPDGDADLDTDEQLLQQLNAMQIPTCPTCQGMMKPDVVFFGENVPRERVEQAMQQLRKSDVLLVAGTSLMVYSGLRFCREAYKRKQPIIIINNGVTRADDIATLRVEGDCGERLSSIAACLS